MACCRWSKWLWSSAAKPPSRCSHHFCYICNWGICAVGQAMLCKATGTASLATNHLHHHHLALTLVIAPVPARGKLHLLSEAGVSHCRQMLTWCLAPREVWPLLQPLPLPPNQWPGPAAMAAAQHSPLQGGAHCCCSTCRQVTVQYWQAGRVVIIHSSQNYHLKISGQHG